MAREDVWDRERREAWERRHPNAFMDHNFVVIREIAEDRAVCELKMRPESRNPYGFCHGGALYTIADDAAGVAAHTDGRSYVTQSSDLHFLSNMAYGTLTGTAKVRRRGQSTCLVAVDITGDDGKLLCTGTFVYFCVDQTVREH